MEPAYVAMNQSAVKRIRKYEGPRMDFDECIGTYRKGTPERIAFLYNLGQWAVFLADRISIPLRVLPDRISERKEEMDRVYSVIRESGLVAEANMPPEYVDGYFHGLYEYFLEAFDQMSVSDYTRGLVEDILAPGIPGRADDELGSAY